MSAFSFHLLFAEVIQAAEQNPPALFLIGIGTILLLRGLRRGMHAWQRRSEDPLKALMLVRGYRTAIIGVCLNAYSLGWWWQINTLMTVALVIGLEEITESSFYIAVLKRQPA
jgi:hypothetical protein